MTVKERPRKPRAKEPARDPIPAHLWGDSARAKRGPKPGLDVESIARAAIAIADKEGLAAVSMKRVAEQFDFTTMSLYRYFPGKAELVALMLDVAMGAPPALDEAGGGWRSKIEAWARHIAEMYDAHPWALEVTSHLRITGPNEFAWMDAAVAALLDTGLSGSEIFDALLLVVGHVRTIAQYSVVTMREPAYVSYEQWESGFEGAVRAHAARYPALLEVIERGAFANPDSDGWEFGLRCVLDGIALRIREKSKKHP